MKITIVLVTKECSLNYHRYLWHQRGIKRCPICNLHIRGPKPRKDSPSIKR